MRSLQSVPVPDSVKLLSDWLVPADEDVCEGGPLDGAVAAEGESRLAVDVLRVPHVRAVVALVYGHVYLCAFGMGLYGGTQKTNIRFYSLINTEDTY